MKALPLLPCGSLHHCSHWRGRSFSDFCHWALLW